MSADLANLARSGPIGELGSLAGLLFRGTALLSRPGSETAQESLPHARTPRLAD
jgi:hypothetical protein